MALDLLVIMSTQLSENHTYMIKHPSLLLICLAILISFSFQVKAELIGVKQNYSDISLNQSYLIYDNNAIDQSTGLLSIVSFSTTLNEGPNAGNSTVSQTYVDAGDFNPDLMLTIAIDRTTGDWVNSSNPIANQLNIGFGNSVIENGTPGFNWAGRITDFGWQQDYIDSANNEYGTFFDASWTMTEDRYQNMPAGMGQYVDNILTSQMTGFLGGIKISNSVGFANLSHPVAFQRDWVMGTNAESNLVQQLLMPFLSGLSSTTCSNTDSVECISYLNSTVTADAFIPIPAAFWLWSGALLALLPGFRVNKKVFDRKK